jgi:tRNA G18 (ribose-2'-O)-methylase SpoU
MGYSGKEFIRLRDLQLLPASVFFLPTGREKVRPDDFVDLKKGIASMNPFLKNQDTPILKLNHLEIVERQKRKQKEKRLPFCVVLNNIRSLYNVGSIFRTGDGVGVEKIWLCGITGYPPNKQIAKTALGAENFIPWEYRQDAVALIKELKALKYQVVLLEQMHASISYSEFVPQAPVCLVIGNEIEGVSSPVVSLCDAAVEIEMMGIKNSLNVSVAFGIVAYHFRRQLNLATIP